MGCHLVRLKMTTLEVQNPTKMTDSLAAWKLLLTIPGSKFWKPEFRFCFSFLAESYFGFRDFYQIRSQEQTEQTYHENKKFGTFPSQRAASHSSKISQSRMMASDVSGFFATLRLQMAHLCLFLRNLASSLPIQAIHWCSSSSEICQSAKSRCTFAWPCFPLSHL